MTRAFFFIVICVVVGAVAISLQWVIPFIKMHFDQGVASSSSGGQEITIPGPRGLALFAALVPLALALWFLSFLASLLAFHVSYRRRRSRRSRAGPLAYVPFSDFSAADELERLNVTFGTGLTRPIAWRRDQLLSLHDLLVEHEEAISTAVFQDLHRTKPEFMLLEVMQIRNEILWLVNNLDRLASPKKVWPSISTWPSSSYIYRDPLGVVLIIGAFNFPAALSFIPLAGAIAGGNCAVLKLPPAAEHFGPLICSLVPKYLDMRAFAIEHSGGPATVQALLNAPKPLDLVFFTGSPRVGQIIYESCSKRLVPVVLELGGKNAAIVDGPACDLRLAAKTIAWGKLATAGQTCIAPDHVILINGGNTELTERFVAELRRAISSMYGETPAAQKASCLPRLISVPTAERMRTLIEANRDKVAFGGDCDVEHCFISPTIVVNPDPESPLLREEIFGPILPVATVASLADAIGLANSHDKPLSVYVFSNHSAVQDRVLRETRSGGASVNDVMTYASSANLPFGGVGRSGIGQYHGKWSFKSFVHERPVVIASWFTRLTLPLRLPPFGWLHEHITQNLLKFFG